jgi:hypothetical protein
MTDVFKKMNFKGQNPILILHAPKAFDTEMKKMVKETTIDHTPDRPEPYAFCLGFGAMMTDLVKAAKSIRIVTTEDSIVWLAYPKQTSKRYTSDLNREKCVEALAPLGYAPVRQIAIDDDWSAIRYSRTGT